MTQWFQSIIWTVGTCTIWCPICIGISGSGSWWVCASTLGLVSITVLSGYATWKIFHNLLTSNTSVHNYISRSLLSNNKNETKSDFVDTSVLEQEISLTAHTFYLHLILPWYSYISPDEKYALQMKSTLEDLLTGIAKNAQQHSDIAVVLHGIINLYIQHYRNFYKTLKKVSLTLKKPVMDCLHEKEEIKNCYNALHPALKTANGTNIHCQRLAHLLLVNYLPSEVSRCSFLFISLRDIFAHKVLMSVLDTFCDTLWLNDTLYLYFTNLSVTLENNTELTNYSSKSYDEVSNLSDKQKNGYSRSLSIISEETSFEVIDNLYTNDLQCDSVDGTCNNITAVTKMDTVKKGLHNIPELEDKDERPTEDNEEESQFKNKRFENTDDLIKYINCPKNNTENLSTKSITTALGGFISTTTVPLLPESLPPLRLDTAMPQKMWRSPMDDKDFLSDVVTKKNPFKKHVVEGLKEDDYNKIYKHINGNIQHNNIPLKQKFKKANFFKDFFHVKMGGILESSEEWPSELHRSKSHDSLFTELQTTLDSTDENASLTKLSFSSEDINTLHLAGILEEADSKNNKKLVKMDSFDKNDGIDQSNSLSKELKHNSTDENVLKNGIGSIQSLTSEELSEESGNESTAAPPLEINNKESSGYCWENSELSPIYEESESLATAIEKLRCLLSERQGQHSLGSQSSFGSNESEPRSAHSDPGRYNLEKSRFTFLHKDSSGSLASLKSSSSTESHFQVTNEEDIMEAAELPLDGRVFTCISIPSTEIQTESTGLQYTVYMIQYDAIYFYDAVVSNAADKNSAIEITEQNIEPKMVLQTNFVKRRFREFLTLHSTFEDEPQFKASMKGVKGPNKWLNLPFSKLDSATVAARRQFLEKYLQAIIQRPILNTSIPFKEFLAYGSDTSVLFVKKPIEINVPRIDKLLARTVSGVFQTLKTALPTFDSPDMTVAQNGDTTVNRSAFQSSQSASNSVENLTKSFLAFEKIRNTAMSGFPPRKQFEIQLDVTAHEMVCEMEGALITAITSSSELNSPVERACEAFESGEPPALSQLVSFLPKSSNQHSYSFVPANPIKYLHKLNSPTNNQSTIGNSNGHSDGSGEIPISPLYINSSLPVWREEDNCADFDEKTHSVFSSFVDAAVEVFSSTKHPIAHQSCIRLFAELFSRPVSTLIKDKLDSLLSSESFKEWFGLLRSYMKETSENECVTDEALIELSKAKLRNILSELLPGILKIALGQEASDECLTLLVESLQHPIMNRDLGLHFIDLIFVHILLPN